MDNLERAQYFLGGMNEATGETILHYAATATAFAAVAIAEKLYEEKDAPEISEGGYRKVMAFLTGNVPVDGFTDGWYGRMMEERG